MRGRKTRIAGLLLCGGGLVAFTIGAAPYKSIAIVMLLGFTALIAGILTFAVGRILAD